MSRTAAEALAWAVSHPDHNGKTWSQCCQAFVVDALSLKAAGNAVDALGRSDPLSQGAQNAPAGALHWWKHPRRNSAHVGIQLASGTILMTDAPPVDQWKGHNTVGDTTVSHYAAKKNGYAYVGWTTTMAGQPLKTSPRDGHGGSPVPPKPRPVVPRRLPRTTTSTTGVPGPIFWSRLQLFAKSHGYTGPINGVMGPGSWRGAQEGLRGVGFTGVATGIQDRRTNAALQMLARRGGYTGPVNGVLGQFSFRGIATWLNAHT